MKAYGTKRILPVYGNSRPLERRINNVKIAGWKEQLFNATSVSQNDTYNDSAFLKIYGKSEQTIPNGYTFYDYIRITNDSDNGYHNSINTGIPFNTANKIEFKYKSTDTLSNILFVSGYLSSTSKAPPYILAHAGSNVIASGFTNSTLTPNNITRSQASDGTIKSFILDYTSSNTNSISFGSWSDNVFSRTIDWYSFKIWNNGTLLRNFIPAKRNSDNILGMYDLVNNVFYTNAGTGNFTAGNVITLPHPDHLVEIKSVENFDLISTDGVEQIQTTNFPYTLRSLNNGAKDYIEIDNVAKTAKLYRNVGEEVFDGTETWAFESGSVRFYTWVEAKKSRESTASLAPISSTHFKTVGNSKDNDLTMREGGNKNVMFKYSALGNNVSSFKSWLADQHTKETPLKIQYELATPTIEDLNYHEVVTYYPYTNIYTNATIQPMLDGKIRIIDRG